MSSVLDSNPDMAEIVTYFPPATKEKTLLHAKGMNDKRTKIDHGTKTLLAVLWSLYRLAIGFHLSIVIAFLYCPAAEAIAMVYIDRLLRQRCYM